MNTGISCSGLEELERDLEKAVSLYENKAKETLQRNGKKFKNRVRKITATAVQQRTGNLSKGYRLSKVKGEGMNMEIEFRATAPHFHLIENGHELTANGRNGEKGTKVGKGFVAGRLIVNQAREEYRTILPQELQNMVNELLGECDL